MAVFSQMTHPSCKMFLNFKKSRTTMFLQMMFLICSVCNTYGVASTALPSCTSDEYRVGQFCCLGCPAGYRVGRDCTATTNSLCSKCPDGTFKEGLSGQKQCTACTKCDTGLKVKKKCTPTSDAECEILDGFFCSDSADKDTFSGATLSCQPHTMCDSGLQIKPGTDSTDSTCIKYVTIVFIIIGCIFLSVLGALVYRRLQKTREGSRNSQDVTDSAARISKDISNTRYGDIRKVETSGASIQTAQQDRLKITGVGASHELAKTDAGRMERYRPIINNVAKKHAVDPALIAAIISRASRAGNIIFNSNPPGWGDNNMSFGLMQINVDPEGGNHQIIGGWNSEEHLDQATGILVYFIQKIQYNRPRWTKEQQLKGGIASYFEGVEAVISYEPEDEPTEGNEYSNDVVARAQLYKSLGF